MCSRRLLQPVYMHEQIDTVSTQETTKSVKILASVLDFLYIVNSCTSYFTFCALKEEVGSK
jgi:hypothetical protein